jgi:signal transduction histidine kinase
LLVELVGDLLRRAVENALRHAPPGSAVAIAARAEAGQARIVVADAGKGVAEDELAAIFEPFYRARDADPFAGHGLGLAITRRVAQLHGGSVTAANRPGGGLAVTPSLPLVA